MYAKAPSTKKKILRDSVPIDMLLSALSFLVVVQSSSEVPEGLMNNPVYLIHLYDCLSYLACKAHLLCTALYGLLWPGWLYQIFPHYFINGMIFRNNLLKTKCVFSFSLLLSETFLILRKTGQDTIINLHTSSCKVPTILVRF